MLLLFFFKFAFFPKNPYIHILCRFRHRYDINIYLNGLSSLHYPLKHLLGLFTCMVCFSSRQGCRGTSFLPRHHNHCSPEHWIVTDTHVIPTHARTHAQTCQLDLRYSQILSFAIRLWLFNKAALNHFESHRNTLLRTRGRRENCMEDRGKLRLPQTRHVLRTIQLHFNQVRFQFEALKGVRWDGQEQDYVFFCAVSTIMPNDLLGPATN